MKLTWKTRALVYLSQVIQVTSVRIVETIEEKTVPFKSIHIPWKNNSLYFKKPYLSQVWIQKNDFSSNMLSKTKICTFFTSLTILVCSRILSTGILVAPICWVIPPASPSCTFVRRIWKMWAKSNTSCCHSFYLGNILKLLFSHYLNLA